MFSGFMEIMGEQFRALDIEEIVQPIAIAWPMVQEKERSASILSKSIGEDLVPEIAWLFNGAGSQRGSLNPDKSWHSL